MCTCYPGLESRQNDISCLFAHEWNISRLVDPGRQWAVEHKDNDDDDNDNNNNLGLFWFRYRKIK